ncbi:MAG: TspO protein [Bacteroidetes bacterium MedPE-SWsnd-G2]|nr:MAG: TspO protein [Bacteroidetes bacterium MedPE-SWsnd-G2]
MDKIKLFFIFLIINLGSLAIGSWLMNDGPTSEWYMNLYQAPWTPPSWVFGTAWTIIMICFSIYLTYLLPKLNFRRFKMLYGAQIILNVSWNYIFFNQHLVFLGLINLILLISLIAYLYMAYKPHLKSKSNFILPYFLWLCVAISLNLYIFVHN